jgi:hypothetical protein
MSNDQPKTRAEVEAELQREFLRDRKFSLADAISRLAGPGMMKGASPIPQKQQAEAEIENHLRQYLGATDSLLGVLLRHAKTSELLLNNSDRPLIVLAACVQRILDSECLLREIVREVDVEWGRLHGERPHFEKTGQPPHPDDPHTVESVRVSLLGLIETLATHAPSE